jgi:hypothetical protein
VADVEHPTVLVQVTVDQVDQVAVETTITALVVLEPWVKEIQEDRQINQQDLTTQVVVAVVLELQEVLLTLQLAELVETGLHQQFLALV